MILEKYKVIVLFDCETGNYYEIYALNKQHAEYIVMNHLSLINKSFHTVAAEVAE